MSEKGGERLLCNVARLYPGSSSRVTLNMFDGYPLFQLVVFWCLVSLLTIDVAIGTKQQTMVFKYLNDNLFRDPWSWTNFMLLWGV